MSCYQVNFFFLGVSRSLKPAQPEHNSFQHTTPGILKDLKHWRSALPRISRSFRRGLAGAGPTSSKKFHQPPVESLTSFRMSISATELRANKKREQNIQYKKTVPWMNDL